MKRKIAIGVENETDTQMLIDMLGMTFFNNLRKHFSGMEIRVPRHPSHDHPIVRKLGRADAELLIRDFGGSLLYIRKSGDGAPLATSMSSTRSRPASGAPTSPCPWTSANGTFGD
jgi:hypothetical protein